MTVRSLGDLDLWLRLGAAGTALVLARVEPGSRLPRPSSSWLRPSSFPQPSRSQGMSITASPRLCPCQNHAMPLFGDRKAPGPSVGRILVATDRSQTADYAVAWAAEMSERYGAELIVLQVVIGGGSASVEELQQFAGDVAGERGRARVVSGDDPADAICNAADEEDVDVVVVGNVGMSGRKEFLLGNVPNRVSHNTRRTVVIVNTAIALEQPKKRFWR